MFGMLCVLLATGSILVFATWLSLPVSTTQTTLGAIMGMSLAFEGSGSCISWHETTETFPWFQGVSLIIISWILAPIGCVLAGFGLLVLVRRIVFEDERRSFDKALNFLPGFVGVTVLVCGTWPRTLVASCAAQCCIGGFSSFTPRDGEMSRTQYVASSPGLRVRFKGSDTAVALSAWAVYPFASI